MGDPLAQDVQLAPGVSLPAGHHPGIGVPKGGSSCANCRFGKPETNECGSPNFVAWNGSATIPAPMDEYCSDWWEPAAQDTTTAGSLLRWASSRRGDDGR